jgi:hypothetical protein
LVLERTPGKLPEVYNMSADQYEFDAFSNSKTASIVILMAGSLGDARGTASGRG